MAKSAYTEGLLPTLSKHHGAIQGLLGQWVTLITGPAESVWLLQFWPDQLFHESKILFLQKASNKQSANVILGLIRLVILSYNR